MIQTKNVLIASAGSEAQRRKLHVIIENDRKKLEADKMQRGLAINQD